MLRALLFASFAVEAGLSPLLRSEKHLVPEAGDGYVIVH
jgi:hypothetical protein